MINYTPQPGTIPFRVIEYFDAHPAVHEMASAVLADELDLDAGFSSSLSSAAKHGRLTLTKREGRVYISRGTRVAPAAPAVDADDVDEQPLVHRIVPAAGPAEPAQPAPLRSPSPFVPRRRARAASPAPQPVGGPPLRVALKSDGELVIQQGGLTFRFDAAETRQIVRYIERLGERTE